MNEVVVMTETANACATGCPFCGINWMWLIIALIVNFAIGAVWHSVKNGFGKMWIEVFKVEMVSKEEMKPIMFIAPMLIQLLAMFLMGLLYFMMPCIWSKIFVCIAIAGWMKGSLMFRYSTNFKNFLKAAWVEVGYFTVASIIFIIASVL